MPQVARVRLAPRDELGHLLDTASTVPPQRADDIDREAPLGEGASIHQSGIARAKVVADDRVLPRGDATAVRVALRLKQGGILVVGRRGGGDCGNERSRALVQGSLRASVG